MVASIEADGNKKATFAKTPSSIDGSPEMIEHANNPATKIASDESRLEIDAPHDERVTPKAWACVFVRRSCHP